MTSLFEFAELSVLEGHIISASIKGTVIVIVAAALCIFLRRGSAAVRHLFGSWLSPAYLRFRSFRVRYLPGK